MISSNRKLKGATDLNKHAKELGYGADLINPVVLNDKRRIRRASPTIYDTDDVWEDLEFDRKFRILLKHYGLENFKQENIDVTSGFLSNQKCYALFYDCSLQPLNQQPKCVRCL